MTEAEWLACDDPEPMLEWLRGSASPRKARLFACACARRICSAVIELRYPDVRDSIVLSEDLADGRADPAQIASAREHRFGIGQDSPFRCAYYAAQETIDEDSITAARGVAGWAEEGFGIIVSDQRSRLARPEQPDAFSLGRRTERVTQAALLCDIFGNPFCPVTFAPEWRTDTAVTLARQMYDSREFSPMPILADALQDAGCDSDDILSHCRGPGPHVRGCWVVDRVLGKE